MRALTRVVVALLCSRGVGELEFHLADAARVIRPPPPLQMAALMSRLRRGDGLSVVATGSSVAAMGTTLGAVVCSSEAALDGSRDGLAAAVNRETHRRPQDGCAPRCGADWRSRVGTPQALHFLEDFMCRLNATWPSARHVLVNLGRHGSGLAAHVHGRCLPPLMPARVDLFVLEHDVITGSAEDLERLVRALRAHAPRAAVLLWHSHQFRECSGRAARVYLGASGPRGGRGRAALHPLIQLPRAYRDADERARSEAALRAGPNARSLATPCEAALSAAPARWSVLEEYYGLATVSVSSFLQDVLARADGGAGNATRSAAALGVALTQDGTHYMPAMHTLMGQLLVALFELQAPLHPPPRAGERAPAAAEPPPYALPAPLVVGEAGDYADADVGQRCAVAAWDAAVARADGFAFVESYQGRRNATMRKPGWQATAPGAELDLDVRAAWRAAFGGEEPPRRVRLALSMLQTYELAGAAVVSCLAGCECEPARFNGLIQKRESISAAVIVDVDVRAEGGGACTLRLEASKENRALEKVKLEQLTLRPLMS